MADKSRNAALRRLFALVAELSGNRLTYRELADRLQVSKKTIRRDIALLRDVGVPIKVEGAVCIKNATEEDYWRSPGTGLPQARCSLDSGWEWFGDAREDEGNEEWQALGQ